VVNPFDELDASDRERFRQMSPAERMRDFGRLQQLYWDRLRADPIAYDAFIRRNFKARAVRVDSAWSRNADGEQPR
jgi:hypothetical protein